MDSYPVYSLTDRPVRLVQHYLKADPSVITYLGFVSKPFVLEAAEGPAVISPETVEGWEGGYVISYPPGGEKPSPLSPNTVRADYVMVVG
jgi:hypothetical protein